MSDFLGSPPARPRTEPDQARTLEMLATLFLVTLVVTALYVGREIFIPIAIAIVLSFVLSPPILLLRRWGLGRIPSVLTVVLAALVIAFLVSAVLTRQASELAVDLPEYQAAINAKIVKLRDAAVDNAFFAKVSAALKNLGEINPPFERARSIGPAKEPTDQGSGNPAGPGRGSPTGAGAFEGAGRAEKPRRNQSASAGAVERARAFSPTKEPTNRGSGNPAAGPGRGSTAGVGAIRHCGDHRRSRAFVCGDDLHRRHLCHLHSFAARGSAQPHHQTCRIERFAPHDPGDE